MTVVWSHEAHLTEVKRLREQLAQFQAVEPLPLMPGFEYLPDPETATVPPLPSVGGGGTSGGVTDDWKASVDRQLGQLHDDVRALLRGGIATAIALAVMVAGLYLYTNTKFDAVNDRIGRLEVQQQKLEGKIEVIDGKLDVLLERRKAGSETLVP